MSLNAIDRLISTPDGQQLLRHEELILEVTEWVVRIMAAKGVTKAQLARKLGKSKGYITQLLGGETNMTLRTISDVFWALDARVQLQCDWGLAGVAKSHGDKLDEFQWGSASYRLPSPLSIELPASDRLGEFDSERWYSDEFHVLPPTDERPDEPPHSPPKPRRKQPLLKLVA